MTFGDGWNPFGLKYEQLRALLERARGWPEWRGRAEAFELVLAPEEPFDVSRPDGVAAAVADVERYQRIGATALNLRFVHRSLEQYVEQLEAFIGGVAARPSDRPD